MKQWTCSLQKFQLFLPRFYHQNGKNTLQKIEDATPTTIESYTYDGNGNTITTNLNRYYYWNHSDQLLCYKNQAGMSNPTVFTQYDYAGQNRVSKMVKTGNDFERTIYIDGIFEYVKLDTMSGSFEKNYIHIMDDKSRIAEVRINPGTPFPGDIADDVVYTLEDQIGSSVARLNTSGTVIDEEEYYPFGDSSLRTFTYKRYRYVGKEKDSESGLYYYGARYYASWTCRFISVDPLAGKYVWQSSYVHADNNPINKVDYDGMGTDGDDKGKGSTTAAPTGGATASPSGTSSPQCYTCGSSTPVNTTTGNTIINRDTSNLPADKSLVKRMLGGDKFIPAHKAEVTYQDNIKSPNRLVLFAKEKPKQFFFEAENRSGYEVEQQIRYNEEVEGSTFRGGFIKYSNKYFNPIRWGMDLYSFGVSNPGFDSKGRSMSLEQAQDKLIGLGLVLTPLKFANFERGLGDLTRQEIKLIQNTVNEAGRPIEIVGSAAKGTRRGVGTDLPIGKGPGTMSDIDYIASPSSHPYFEGLKLPSIDPKTGIIPGFGNVNIGPVIRFTPNAKPIYIKDL